MNTLHCYRNKVDANSKMGKNFYVLFTKSNVSVVSLHWITEEEDTKYVNCPKRMVSNPKKCRNQKWKLIRRKK